MAEPYTFGGGGEIHGFTNYPDRTKKLVDRPPPRPFEELMKEPEALALVRQALLWRGWARLSDPIHHQCLTQAILDLGDWLTKNGCEVEEYT